MIKGGTKQRAALQAAGKLSGKLFHAPDGRQLRHVLLEHFEILEQQRALVLECRLESFAAMHGVFDLTKDPGIGHGPTADQNSVTAGFAKACACLID